LLLFIRVGGGEELRQMIEKEKKGGKGREDG